MMNFLVVWGQTGFSLTLTDIRNVILPISSKCHFLYSLLKSFKASLSPSVERNCCFFVFLLIVRSKVARRFL